MIKRNPYHYYFILSGLISTNKPTVVGKVQLLGIKRAFWFSRAVVKFP